MKPIACKFIVGSQGRPCGQFKIAIFRNEWGRCYGLKEIGNRKSWHRWQTPDGQKHRFAKDAIAHLDGQQLRRKANEIRQKAYVERELARMERERSEREAILRQQAIHSLAVAWRAHKVFFGDVPVRPQAQAAA